MNANDPLETSSIRSDSSSTRFLSPRRLESDPDALLLEQGCSSFIGGALSADVLTCSDINKLIDRSRSSTHSALSEDDSVSSALMRPLIVKRKDSPFFDIATTIAAINTTATSQQHALTQSTTRGNERIRTPKNIGTTRSLIQRTIWAGFECLTAAAYRVYCKGSNIYNRVLYHHQTAQTSEDEENELRVPLSPNGIASTSNETDYDYKHGGENEFDYMNEDYFHPGSISSQAIPVKLKRESPQVLKAAPMILTPIMMKQLVDHGLSSAIGLKRWKRLYSVARDGDSFLTFLDNVQHEKHTIIVVKTMEEDILGAFVDTEWERGHGIEHVSFYGTGQSFVFAFNAPQQQLSIYKWTGKNNYNQLCDASTTMIALGGGGYDANFGLCIEECFRKGSSGDCETYGNPPLASKEFFDILAFEVYGFENSW